MLASLCYGPAMSKLRKITVSIPARDLQLAQDLTGKNVTETVRIALHRLAQMHVQQRLLALRGKVKFSLDLDELRHDRR